MCFSQRVLGRDESGNNEELPSMHPDPFLRSMAYWVMRQYSASLQTLLCTDPSLATCHPAYDDTGKQAGTVTTGELLLLTCPSVLLRGRP